MSDQPSGGVRVRRAVKPDGLVRHGTISAYTNDRCRCDLCTWAWSGRRRGDSPDMLPAPPWFEAWSDAMAVSL